MVAHLVLLIGFAIAVVGSALAQTTCAVPPISLRPDHNRVYRVGVLAIRGEEQAFDEFNWSFSLYLSLTAGAKFDPPISFEMGAVPVSGRDIDILESGEYDFIFANPTIFSCVQSEVGANSLASMISRRQVNGQVYGLVEFGGVIFTLANNSQIETVSDVRGKRVATASVTGLGSGQMQFRELRRAGLHHFNDLKQLIFMRNQDKVVNAVLQEKVDVGFVRTDQLERSTDELTGAGVNLTRIKIIGGRNDLISNDGTHFPFASSTPLYPEWSLGSLPSVHKEVARAVQASLLELAQHASVGAELQSCYAEANCTDSACYDDCFATLSESLPAACDSSVELALLAEKAMLKGRYAGWRTTLSYMELRNMQQEIAFIKHESGRYRCARSTEIANVVDCPPGHFQKSRQDIATGCETEGLDCYGHQCICSPCVKAFDVDFFPVGIISPRGEYISLASSSGCSKFSVCGVVEQSGIIIFRAVDNKKRAGKSVSVHVQSAHGMHDFDLTRGLDDGANATTSELFWYEFQYDASGQPAGTIIMEVFIDGVQIPESPFRVQVDHRDCGETAHRVPDDLGHCVCATGSVEIGSRCVLLAVLLPSVFLALAVVAIALMFVCIEVKRKQQDAIWKVNPKELLFDDPPKILGQGTFGLVLLAEYRGTQVAVKRVLPSKNITKKTESKDTACSVGDVLDASFEGAGSPFDYREDPAPSSNDPIAKRNQTDRGASRLGLKSGFVARKGFEQASGIGTAFGSIGGFVKSSALRRDNRYSQLKKDFIEEMRTLSKLRHPQITTTLGAVISPNSEPMLIMEYMQLGSLNFLLHNDSLVLEQEVVIPILRDIAQGLRFLHAATPQVVHGDLKAQNVLVDSKLRAKVADFGLSQKSHYQRRNATGTPFWMAPELIRGESGNSASADIYSFGILLFEVFARKDPYEGEDPGDVLRQVADRAINKRPPIPRNCPKAAADLMKACQRSNPSDRPSAEEIDLLLKTSFSVENLDPGSLLSSMQMRESDAAAVRTEELLSQLFPKHVAAALCEGRKVEPQNFECVTVFFSDIVGFTDISSQLSPTKVSHLLDRLYTKFDALVGHHHVFKVETVGDAYMCVTNLALPQRDHVGIMSRFAFDAIDAASLTLIDEDDPSKGYLQIRVGIHSGPVVAHVIGFRTPRYSIIGDTVNTAARMESSSSPGCIQCSEQSARLLNDRTSAISTVRRGTVLVKGKGEMLTFWVRPSEVTNSESHTLPRHSLTTSDKANTESESAIMTQLIEFNYDLMQGLLLEVTACRDVPTIEEVDQQLHDFCVTAAHMYQKENPFNNLEHASHVTMALSKLLNALEREREQAKIRTPLEQAPSPRKRFLNSLKLDPLTRCALITATLCHGVAHPGVCNVQLDKEKSAMAAVYNGRSISEQNAFAASWKLLDCFDLLQQALFASENEKERFRTLVYNGIMATDVVGNAAAAASGWDKAFLHGEKGDKSLQLAALMESLVQASKVAHMHQHWEIYMKWASRQLLEDLKAYRDGRLDQDPSNGSWYQGQLECFDSVVIPLMQRLNDCGLLGQLASDSLSNARGNRDAWREHGPQIVANINAKALPVEVNC